MKFPKTIKLVFIVVFIPLLLISCTESNSTQFFAMDTLIEITAYGKNSGESVNLCEAEVNRLEKLFSADMKDSELYNLNINGRSKVSNELYDVIIKSEFLSEATDGNFDIALRNLIKLWGFSKDSKHKVPSASEISEFLSKSRTCKTEYGNVINLNNCSIDLGAVAKGYTSSKLAKILESNGIKSAIINLGGNIRLIGKNPGGDDWKIGIKYPDSEDGYFGTLSLSDTSVITSGGYQRYFESNGERYHHILDPKTGYPADSGLVSVTVISDDDAVADAFSTAIYVGGEKLAKKLQERFNIEYVLVTNNKEIILSSGIIDKFELTDVSYKIKSN